MIENVKKRDFLHYPNRYLKEGAIVLTKHGKPQYMVSITNMDIKYEELRGRQGEVTVQVQQ